VIRPQIFVTYALPAPVLARLAQVCDYRIGSQHSPLERSALLAGVRDAHGIVSLITDRIDREVIEAGQHVRIIANVGVGYNNVDVAAARQRGIVVSNTPDVLTDATADLTWGLILAVTRRIVEADVFTRAGRFTGWDFELLLGSGLNGKTLGIIGYGRISRELAPVLAAMGMTVLVSDPYAQVDDRRFLKLSMEDLLARADYVICLAIANAETENLMNEAAFARMKPDAFFINMSRGNLVDEAALLKVLTQNRIAGAALDVGRAPDQMPSPELARLANVVATPHIGGLTPPASESQAFDTVRQVEALVKGEMPPGAANPKDWTRRPW